MCDPRCRLVDHPGYSPAGFWVATIGLRWQLNMSGFLPDRRSADR
jgi:hypothetical protein